MDQLIIKKIRGLIGLLPNDKGVRTIIKLQNNKGERTESLSLEVTGAGILGNMLLLQFINGKSEEKKISLDHIFDLEVPNQFLTIIN